MVCEKCNNLHDGRYGSGRFCSAKCARGFSSLAKREEINERVRKTLKAKYESGEIKPRSTHTNNLADHPFSEYYLYVSLDKKRGRKIAILINGKLRMTMLLSRYLMSISLGRILSPDETVDHIDGDKANDSLDNLQILSRRENIIKWHKQNECNCEQGHSFKKELVCEICETSFFKSIKFIEYRLKTQKRIFCSKECSYLARKKR